MDKKRYLISKKKSYLINKGDLISDEALHIHVVSTYWDRCGSVDW